MRTNWLKERGKGIGGSDAAAIIGQNPYKNNVDLWKEKVGLIEPKDISEKNYVKYGVAAEELLRNQFILDYPKYKVEYSEYNILKHSKYDFLLASLDGTITDTKTNEKGVLEIKTTNILQSRQKENWDNRIPDNYYCQILHYLNVTGYTFAILKADLKSDFNGNVYHQIKHYKIERKDVEEDIKYLEQKEIEFWDYVERKQEPPQILPQI